MRKFYISILLSAGSLMGYAQNFDANSVVVSRVTGTATSGASVDLVSYPLTGGAAGTSISNAVLKGSLGHFVVSGTDNAEGQIMRSGNGMYLTLIGTNTAPGTALNNVANLNRSIVRVPNNPANLAHTTFTVANAGLGRSAVTNDGLGYWYIAGTSGNASYVDHGATSEGTVVVNNGGNFHRYMLLFNADPTNALSTKARLLAIRSFSPIFSFGAGSNPLTSGTMTVGTLAVAPSTGEGDALGNSTGANIQSIAFLDMDPAIDYDGTGYDVMYISVIQDNATDGILDRGLHKFVWDPTASKWLNTSTETAGLALGATDYAGPIIATKNTDGKAVIYAVTMGGNSYGADNSLYVLVDNGTRTSALSTTNTQSKKIAGAGAGTIFKGLAFAPTATASAAPIVNTEALNTFLPVTINSFTAQAKNSSVKLTWSTLSEVNFKEFLIERSADGKSFSTLATVSSKGISSGSDYTYEDNNPVSGTSYYRLKSIDFDGTSKYFDKVVDVNISLNSNSGIILYPNPAQDFITVKYPEAKAEGSILIYSLTGAKVGSAKVSRGQSTTTLSISDLASGTYIVKFNSDPKATLTFIKN